jgi:hypothetical protein
VIRAAAILAGLALLALLFGARTSTPGEADPVRRAWLLREAAAHAEAADGWLAVAERLMRGATDQARRGQAAVLAGPGDPEAAMNLAAVGFESAATPLSDAQTSLVALRWTLHAIDPAIIAPASSAMGGDAIAVAAQWRAAALPSAALADLRREAEATLDALGDALAALEADDPVASLAALDAAEAGLDEVATHSDDLAALGYWVETVQELIDAARGIALAVLAGDPVALAEAQAAYDVAAADANRADQALTIALGEAVVRTTGPAAASSAALQREVEATRDQLAGLSILR